MKKRNKKQLDELKTMLAPINKEHEIPGALSGDAITALIESESEKKQSKKAKHTLEFRKRGVAALAAAFVVLIGTGAYASQTGLFEKDAPPTAIVGSETPLSGNSREDVEARFTQLKKEYDEANKRGIGDYVNDMIGGMKGSTSINESAAAPTQGMGGDANADYGKTNIQVKGVDEADIIKNDGKYLYCLTKNTVKIVFALPADSMKLLSTITVPGYKDDSEIEKYYSGDSDESIEYIFPNSIYVSGDTLAIICTKQKYVSYSADSRCVTFLYDVSDRSAPKLIKEFSQDGSSLTSRLIGDKLYIVSQYNVNLSILNGDDVKYENIVPTAGENGKCDCVPPENLTILPNSENKSSYIVVSGVAIKNFDASSSTSAVLGGSSNAYCTADALYVASVERNWISSTRLSDFEISDAVIDNRAATTYIYRFNLNNGNVSFSCSGSVEGSFLNQFSMDEYNGNFRIATTSYKNNDEINLLTVLNSKLEKIGAVENFAKGETIQSVRYVKDTAYVVTYEQTDPLFVIDLSNPTAPKIVGELKIPGFSGYMHPYGDSYLIGIGEDGDENGLNGGIKISLFDISDPGKPIEKDKLTVPDAYVNVQYDHKSVMDCTDKGILGVCYGQYIPFNGEKYGLNVVKFMTFTVKDGRLVKQLDVADTTNAELAFYGQKYYSGSDDDISSIAEIMRGTYIGQNLYTLSESRICSRDLFSGANLGKIDL